MSDENDIDVLEILIKIIENNDVIHKNLVKMAKMHGDMIEAIHKRLDKIEEPAEIDPLVHEPLLKWRDK